MMDNYERSCRNCLALLQNKDYAVVLIDMWIFGEDGFETALVFRSKRGIIRQR